MKAGITTILVLAFVWATGHAEDAQADANEAYARVLQNLGVATTAGPDNRLRFLSGRPTDQQLDAGARLQDLIEARWRWLMNVSPEDATFIGHAGQNNRWSDYGDAARQAQQKLKRRTLEVLLRIPRDQLSPADALNHRLLEYELKLDIEGHAFPEHLIPINQMYGPHTGFAQVLSAMPLFSRTDADDYLARLRGIPVVLNQLTGVLRRGIELGITPPQQSIRAVPKQVRDLAPPVAEQSPLLRPLQQLRLPPEAAEAVRMQAGQIYQETVRPALVEFADFLERKYLPGATQRTGLSRLPEGQAWYAWRIKTMTSLPLDAEQIHAIGLAEVERIRGQMFQLMGEMGAAGQDIPSFVADLYRNEAQFYRAESELLRDYRALAKQADGVLGRLFKKYPSLPYGVEPIPAHEASGRPAAYYLPGSYVTGRPAAFYVNTKRLDQSPKFEMDALLLHEGVPGHHFQIALAQEQSDLPEFRRHSRGTAYIEGWGLYAESLGSDLGFYQTPESRFGALSFEMWRAVRLVVDTGMHALGWTRQQAIDYFKAQTGRHQARISVEVDRYLVMPGQALAYKMGEMKIRQLREHAQVSLGAQFDIRDFHDRILREGPLPLTILEEQINAWIQTKINTK